MNKPLDLSAIKARAEAATPGPWSDLCYIVYAQTKPGSTFDIPLADASLDECPFSHDQCEANAQFIAHARTDIPALIAEVERLNGEVARLRLDNERLCKALAFAHGAG